LTCFEQVIVCRQEFCTSSLQYFAMHLKSQVANMIQMILDHL